MAEVPGFLLVHHCTVEPYVDWGVYGAGFALKCFIAEKLAPAGPAGTERVAQITIVCRPREPVTAGSRIILGDGRRGYASAVAIHDGGGLPTPAHREIAMQIAGAHGPAYGETIRILYRTTARDAAGAARYSWAPQEVPGAGVRMLSSSEAAVGSAEAVSDTVEVILPPGTPISTKDRLQVRGLLYDVDGTPTEVTSSQTTARPGVRVIGKRRDT